MNVDVKNRKRNVVVAFRMSPQEAEELNVKVALSGLTKQDYIIQSLLKHELKIVGCKKIAKRMESYLETMLDELQMQEEINPDGADLDDLLMPLQHILNILNTEEQEKQNYARDNI
jgi:hypothetical protein